MKTLNTNKYLYILLISISVFTNILNAQPLDEISSEALRKTMEMLNNPVLRAQALNENQRGQIADKKASDLVAGNPEDLDAIYRLSSSVMSSITNAAGGDINRMNEILFELQSNPESMAQYLSSSDLKKLKVLAKKIEAQK